MRAAREAGKPFSDKSLSRTAGSGGMAPVMVVPDPTPASPTQKLVSLFVSEQNLLLLANYYFDGLDCGIPHAYVSALDRKCACWNA